MWQQFLKDYLSFTKKDRAGIIVLVVLIFIVVLLPYIWPAKKINTPEKKEIEKIKAQVALLKKADDLSASAYEKHDDPVPRNYPPGNNYHKQQYALFYFDPNKLDIDGWERLGIREKTATTIQKYIAKGGKFKKPGDIGKIYGLFKDDYERLLPYVRIAGDAALAQKNETQKNETVNYNGYPKKEITAFDKPSYPARKTIAGKIIEINSADTTALIALPGIGSKLAARIVSFRDKLGGFYDVQQIGETYGLPDSTFNKIKTVFQCNAAAVHQLNINAADANALKQHPYIRWNLANAIVQYRAQHGNFKSVNDLQLIAIITPELFKKMQPYLSVQ